MEGVSCPISGKDWNERLGSLWSQRTDLGNVACDVLFVLPAR